MPTPKVVHEPAAMRAHCAALRSGGASLGLVPTMGALHAGHLSLVDAVARAGATRVAVSIFVNPLQFAEGEDLDAYPRTLPEDLALLESRGVDLVYAPNAATMYPTGFQTHVEVTGVSQPLEGRARPSHYRGVTTVVAKLFNAAGPCTAAFGEKDYQQLQVIRRMVTDLDMPVRVLPCPIHREADGLAMSSRNRYLDPAQRLAATAIHAGMRAAVDAYTSGERRRETLRELAQAPIAERFDRIDYVSLVDPESLENANETLSSPTRLLVAAHLGRTRLIDNIQLG